MSPPSGIPSFRNQTTPAGPEEVQVPDIKLFYAASWEAYCTNLPFTSFKDRFLTCFWIFCSDLYSSSTLAVSDTTRASISSSAFRDTSETSSLTSSWPSETTLQCTVISNPNNLPNNLFPLERNRTISSLKRDETIYKCNYNKTEWHM